MQHINLKHAGILLSQHSKRRYSFETFGDNNYTSMQECYQQHYIFQEYVYLELQLHTYTQIDYNYISVIVFLKWFLLRGCTLYIHMMGITYAEVLEPARAQQFK